LSLQSPRRIFVRSNRIFGPGSVSRAAALLMLASTAAFWVTVMAAEWPAQQSPPDHASGIAVINLAATTLKTAAPQGKAHPQARF